MNTFATSEIESSLCAALCEHCAEQRQANPGAIALERLPLLVLSGCCHDCGGGFCLCRGHLACERCPRKNARVILEALSAWRVVVPAPPPTQPNLGNAK
jgi:hypothetical protein